MGRMPEKDEGLLLEFCVSSLSKCSQWYIGSGKDKPFNLALGRLDRMHITPAQL
jgi:hypothetical protein